MSKVSNGQGVQQQMTSEGGAQYEYVEGTIMDTHPNISAMAGGMQDTIPDIETRDIHKMPDRGLTGTSDDRTYPLTPDESWSSATSDSEESDGPLSVSSQTLPLLLPHLGTMV